MLKGSMLTPLCNAYKEWVNSLEWSHNTRLTIEKEYL
jgi:hypothetical protein